MMYVKIHSSGERFQQRAVIAVCDAVLIGKKIKGKNIEITATEHFYKGEKKSAAEVIPLLRDATNCNLLGKGAVEAGIAAGIINKKAVIMIGEVPYAHAISA